MINLLLSPKGKISSSQMLKGGLILIGLGFIMNLPPIVGAMRSLGTALFLLGFVLLIPWVFLWMKRYRDARQHPAMCLIPIMVFALVYVVIYVAMNWGLLTEAINISLENGGDQEATNEAMLEVLTDEKLKMMNFSLVFGPTIAALLTLFGFNALIKHKPENTETFS